MVYGKLTPEVLAIIMAQRFMMPFAFAGRWPTEREIAKALESIAAQGASEEDMVLFAKTLMDIKSEAARILPTQGTA